MMDNDDPALSPNLPPQTATTPFASTQRNVAHTLAALVLASGIEEGYSRVKQGVEQVFGHVFQVEIEHDQNYTIDGRFRFLVYCYDRDGNNNNTKSGDGGGSGGAGGMGGDRTGEWGGNGGGGGAAGIQEMREMVKRVIVLNGKMGYICNGRPSNFRLNITPTAKMTAKEVVRQLVVNEAVQKHTESALGAPVETLLIGVTKNSVGRDERELPVTVLTVSHPLVAYHLMLFSIRGLIRQQHPIHSSNPDPLPLLLEPSLDNPPSIGAEVIQNKLPGVGLCLQLLRYPKDGGRHLGERRVLQHASALIEGCRKWKKENEELELIGPVAVSIYVVHEDYTTDVQVRSLIHCAAERFVEFLRSPVSEHLRIVPPVWKHRLPYRSPSIVSHILNGKEFYERYGRERGNVRNRAHFQRRERERRMAENGGAGFDGPNGYMGGPPPRGGYGGNGGGYRGGGGGGGGRGFGRYPPGPYGDQGQRRYPPGPGGPPTPGGRERFPKRDRSDYDEDKMDVVKRSRIDMPLQPS